MMNSAGPLLFLPVKQVSDRRPGRGLHDRRLRHRLHFYLHHLHRHRLLRFPGKDGQRRLAGRLDAPKHHRHGLHYRRASVKAVAVVVGGVEPPGQPTLADFPRQTKQPVPAEVVKVEVEPVSQAAVVTAAASTAVGDLFAGRKRRGPVEFTICGPGKVRS